MTDRVFNFSPGPAVLPRSVLEHAQQELLALPGVGMSILEISHRSKAFDAILAEATQGLRDLLAVPEGYHILFLQGGASLQFYMVALNFLRSSGKRADYVLTGAWGKKALEEARREGETHVAWDGKATNYDRLPKTADLKFTTNAAYVHYTDNETIQGVEFPTVPEIGNAPLVCDASSNFLSRPVPINRLGLLYACAQKNAGPSGVTVVIIRDEVMQRAAANLPPMLDYRQYAANESRYNTPPTFGIYVVMLICRWLKSEIGGLAKMQELNKSKATLLYDVLDKHPKFFQGHAQPDCRSLMNVTFRLPNEELEKAFLEGAKQHKLIDLKGHRSVGGIRASIYNAMPREGVETLRQYMLDFAKQRG
ncbi:MAG TPA: 3-phosphoserine/phosphohydroxythreonine transaminase [Pirellulales bacterium]|jgi:phosphoserine aminotransferase|nr:3-phosphoserine/phosphohydroxythreonine transaminase [Pirellulales bacterium]